MANADSTLRTKVRLAMLVTVSQERWRFRGVDKLARVQKAALAPRVTVIGALATQASALTPGATCRFKNECGSVVREKNRAPDSDRAVAHVGTVADDHWGRRM